MTTGASEKPQNALPVFKADRSIVGDRRERWWFSAGALVSQGQTTAVVGAVWTHWLADRQVPLLVGPYDDTFALDLFHDTQRQAGGVVDDAAGAFLADCVAVLRSRGLLADCFQCTTMESVIDALLGYGPVVAGLHWRESMFQPDRDAGPPICRVAPNSPAVGGHAVLLDGISLDLQLDGVTGFIRFKNSWGQDWGENGLCLISIDDLEQLFDSTQSFFAVPEESPPLAEDPGSLVFPSETAAPPSRSQPRYEPVRYEQQPIGSDRYTILDTIGYGPYATAIAQGIQHHLTKPPLTIGIKAPWGAGKTSLMRMIQRRLEWPETWATVAADAKLPDVPLSGDHKHLTNGSLLRLLSGRSGRRKQRAPAGHSPAAPAETGRMRRLLSRRSRSPAQEAQAMQGRAVTPAEQSPLWRPTIWFNPWMYQTGEQVWAGFACEIIDQITSRLPLGDRERFWLNLNRTRIDEQAVRRKVYALIFDRVLPWLLGAALLAVGGLCALAAGLGLVIGGALTASGPVALVLATSLQSFRVLRTSVAGPLRSVVEPTAAVTNLATGGLPGTFETLVSDPGYAAHSGYFRIVRSDVQHVIDLVATGDRPLVIFVDDLDRCAPGTVVQVMEAINLFLAGEFSNAVFVVAIEPEMVAAHIEVAYRDLVANIGTLSRSKGAGETLGWRFLEKFIQLPLTLPLMEPQRTEVFVGGLFSPETDDARATEGTTPPPASLESAAAVAGARGILSQKSLAESVELASSLDAASVVGEAFPLAVADKLTPDSPEMKQVIDYGADFLRGNPRELKRYVNVFRFLVMLSTTRPRGEDDPPDQLTALAKLAVLTTRWPSVVSQLTWPLGESADQTVFDLLENPPKSAAKTAARRAAAELASLTRSLAACGFRDAAVQRLIDDDLRRFMCTEPRIGARARNWI